jgi:hypothetical protein
MHAVPPEKGADPVRLPMFRIEHRDRFALQWWLSMHLETDRIRGSVSRILIRLLVRHRDLLPS